MKSSFSIVAIYVIGSSFLWSLVIGVCWGVYYLKGPYNEFNEQLKIFKWIYHATDVYLPLMAFAVFFLTTVSYKKKERFIYKGFLFSSIYGVLICILYFLFIHV